MANFNGTENKKICQVENCNKPMRRNGYCERHAMQIKRCGKIIETYLDRPRTICKVKNCCGKCYNDDLCKKHYNQLMETGRIEEVIREKCKVDWCNEPSGWNGYCDRHAMQISRKGEIFETYFDLPKRVCSVEGCTEPHSSNGYCSRHSMQMLKHGKIFERTHADRNEYRFEGDNCYITLYDKNNNPKAEAIIDKEDYKKVKDHKWGMNSAGYITRSTPDGTNKEMYLSRFLLFPLNNPLLLIDHKNRNPLDNRKQNLREATWRQNSANAKLRKDNQSGYKGVGWHKLHQKWASTICKNGRRVHIGFFKSKIHAAIAYNCMAIKLFGDFAVLNDIEYT